MTRPMLPFVVGIAMAPMVLMALHGPLSRGEGLGPALMFVGAHVAIVVLLALAALLLPGRASGVLRKALRHITSHAPAMGSGLLVAILAIHLRLHGGVM